MTDNSNITKLDVRRKPDRSANSPIRAVKNFKCKHDNMLVDETRSEIECGDCGQLLNPIAVLARLAKKDNDLYWRRESLRKEVDSYQDRLRFKCGACGQVNNVTKPLKTRALEDK